MHAWASKAGSLFLSSSLALLLLMLDYVGWLLGSYAWKTWTELGPSLITVMLIALIAPVTLGAPALSLAWLSHRQKTIIAWCAGLLTLYFVALMFAALASALFSARL